MELRSLRSLRHWRPAAGNVSLRKIKTEEKHMENCINKLFELFSSQLELQNVTFFQDPSQDASKRAPGAFLKGCEKGLQHRTLWRSIFHGFRISNTQQCKKKNNSAYVYFLHKLGVCNVYAVHSLCLSYVCRKYDFSSKTYLKMTSKSSQKPLKTLLKMVLRWYLC